MKTKEKKDTGRMTIEEFMRACIGTPKEHDVIQLMQTLPEASKEKYREIWKRLKAERAVPKGTV